MKHRAPQFDLPGTHQQFNLANGEGIDWQARQIAKERFEAMRRACDQADQVQPELLSNTETQQPRRQ